MQYINYDSKYQKQVYDLYCGFQKEEDFFKAMSYEEFCGHMFKNPFFKDEANFIALKDVLSRAMNSTNSVSSASYGDIIYDININVDKIEKDYDVDKVAERVKKIIVKDSSYRNVTQVRKFR
jgi:hypothetical protein